MLEGKWLTHSSSVHTRWSKTANKRKNRKQKKKMETTNDNMYKSFRWKEPQKMNGMEFKRE